MPNWSFHTTGLIEGVRHEAYPRWGRLGKECLQVHGVDHSEKTIWRRKLVRGDWIEVLLERIEPGCEIEMEACSGAHHWARLLQAKGYTVKLIAPQFVKPYVKSNKNDANDAEAICEAMSRPSMRFVAVKTVEQQDIQAVHRVRSGLMDQRKAKANQLRGLTSEYRFVAPKELLHLVLAIPRWPRHTNSCGTLYYATTCKYRRHLCMGAGKGRKGCRGPGARAGHFHHGLLHGKCRRQRLWPRLPDRKPGGALPGRRPARFGHAGLVPEVPWVACVLSSRRYPSRALSAIIDTIRHQGVR